MGHPKQLLVTDLFYWSSMRWKIIPKFLRSAGPGNTPFGNAPDGPLFPKRDQVAAACSVTALPRISGGCPAEHGSLLLPYIRLVARGGIAVEAAWGFLGKSCINFQPFVTSCRIASVMFLLTSHTSCFVGGRAMPSCPQSLQRQSLLASH